MRAIADRSSIVKAHAYPAQYDLAALIAYGEHEGRRLRAEAVKRGLRRVWHALFAAPRQRVQQALHASY